MTKPHPRPERTFFRTVRGTLVLLALLLLSLWLGLRLGSVSIPTSSFWSALFGKEGYETHTAILYTLRLPRVLGGALAGMGLAVSGVLLQSVTDNALAGPGIIGVNAGAGLAVALMLTLFPAALLLLPLAAFLGALLATLLILLLSERAGADRRSVILAGVALSTLFGAGISAVHLLDPDALVAYNAFSVGSLVGVTLKELLLPAIAILLSFLLALLFSERMDLLSLGDATAHTLGLRVRRVRLLLTVAASASAAAAVSFAGLVGFVGLIVPHIGRRLVGHRAAPLLRVSALVGAILTVLSDLAGRLLAAPSELPVGIMMAILGVPFFLSLLLGKEKTR